MMYKLLNKLFGWDYVQWKNTADQGIARAQVDGMRRIWYWRYKGTKVADIIHKPEQVIWLTCNPNKYFPPSVPKPTNADVLTALKRSCRFIDSIPYYIDTDGTVNLKDILAASSREIIALRQTIEQIEGTKQ
jgi:hypothetical protein